MLNWYHNWQGKDIVVGQNRDCPKGNHTIERLESKQNNDSPLYHKGIPSIIIDNVVEETQGTPKAKYEPCLTTMTEIANIVNDL